MERLPPELLAYVCSLSDIRSLKKIRLVKTNFAHIAAQYLFKELYLTVIPTYLEKVTEVAFHPTLRSHVRILYFDGEILNETFADYETWEAAVDTRDQIVLPTGETRAKLPETPRWRCSQADLDRAHTTFNRLLASQKALFHGRMDLVLLSTALAMLPNLQTIESIDTSYLHLNLRAAAPYDSVTGRDEIWFPILSDLHRDTFLPDPFVDPTVSTQPGLAQPLASFICGLGLARKQIRTLELDNIPWEFWKQACPSGFEHSVRPFIRVAFQYLESLKIHFKIDGYDLEVLLEGLIPLSISTCIEAAAGLRLLDVGFTCYGEGDHDKWEDGFWQDFDFETLQKMRFHPRAGHVFATPTLPNLAIFRLGDCSLTTESLVGFIRRHTAKLEEIRISFVDLDDKTNENTSWEKALKQIAPTLCLNCVKLEWLDSDEIRKVELEDTFNTQKARNAAYCQSLEHFLYHRGQTECPRYADFGPSGAKYVQLSSSS